MRLLETGWLELMWLVPVAVALLAWSLRCARMARNRFVDRTAPRWMVEPFTLLRGAIRIALLVLAMTAIVFALARPVDRERLAPVTTMGRDVCFVVDVSRSMLAEDIAPNRLERTKLWLRDVIGVLEGDRVALVAFAGSGRVMSPLTHDYGFLATMVDDLRPESVEVGGTMIGDAIRLALDRVFDEGGAERFQDIVLITDGEDQGSMPVAAAEAMGERGIRLIAIGVGDPSEGARIPISQGGEVRFVVDEDGEPVVSRLDEQTLRDMVAQTPGGRYYSVQIGDIQLDQIYRTLIGEAEQRVLQTTESTVYREWFPTLLGLAAMMLALEVLLARR